MRNFLSHSIVNILLLWKTKRRNSIGLLAFNTFMCTVRDPASSRDFICHLWKDIWRTVSGDAIEYRPTIDAGPYQGILEPPIST